MRSNVLGLAAAISLSAGIGHIDTCSNLRAYEYRAPKRARGHWGAKSNCQKLRKIRAAAKRAKAARKLHRK